MTRSARQLCLLLGMWFSVVALTMAVSVFLPERPAKDSPALLYPIDSVATSSRVSEQKSERALIANLESMQLSLYENAELIKTFPILSKGKEGTPWETPLGKYAIQLKEERHFSSIGGVWMPYSMQFYGNFFIHGWPTYPDGRNVPIGFSGGCIRLRTADAKEVYEFAPPGTRLLVEGGGAQERFSLTSRYYLRGGGSPPTLSAPSFLAADLLLNTVLWERKADMPVHPDDLVALVSGLTALETVDQYKVVRMSELLMGRPMLRKTSIGAADELPVGTLIYPLIFGGNDTAAKVFAREHGTKQFVKYMNEKADAIGMEQSEFSGALAIDDATTTARDLFLLLQYIDRSKHFLIDVSQAPERILYDKYGDERYRWENKNPWVRGEDARYKGGMISISGERSGSAMVLFDLPVSEFGGRTVALIVLHSDDVKKDVEDLRDFVSAHFVYGVTRETPLGEEAPPSSLFDRADPFDVKKLLEDKLEYEKEI